MRAVIYARISRDRVGAGLGVERQEGDCRQLCDGHGWDVVEVLVDNDISAYGGKVRPGYRRLLELIRSGGVDVVVAWHTDRLHRRPSELEEYISACELHNVATHSVKAGLLDLSTPNGRMIARVSGAFATYEVDQIRGRVIRAKQQAAESGLYRGGRRPFGYEGDGVTVRPAEAVLVLAASRAVLEGRSLGSIAAEWTLAGHRTSTGAMWTANGMRKLLVRPRNAGLIERDGVVVGAARWPAIVPEDVWRGVVAVLRDPGRRTTTDMSRKHLGTGLYRCGLCAGAVAVTTGKSSRGRRIYRCSAVAHVQVDLEHCDEYIRTAVVARLRRGDLASVLAPEDDGAAGRLEAEVAGLRARLKELSTMFAAGLVTGEQLADGSGKMMAQLERAESLLGRALAGSGLESMAGAPDPGQAWLDAPLGQRRQVLAALATVTLLPAGRGRPAGWQGGSYFRPESVDIQWERL